MALQMLRQEAYDVALIDVMMPKLDGYHVASMIRGLPNPPKIVIVTSRNYDKDRNVLEMVGVDAFLPKPFSNRDLLEVVTTLIKRKKAETDSSLDHL
jgi:DNA-binding response OmpR family regulator